MLDEIADEIYGQTVAVGSGGGQEAYDLIERDAIRLLGEIPDDHHTNCWICDALTRGNEPGVQGFFDLYFKFCVRVDEILFCWKSKRKSSLYYERDAPCHNILWSSPLDHRARALGLRNESS